MEDINFILIFFNSLLLIISPLYYIVTYCIQKNKTKHLEKTIIIKNIEFEYYRDIINEYSPAVLSFILDGSELNKDLAASLVYLINKGYLELEDNNEILPTRKDYSELPEDLQILCKSDVNYLLTGKIRKNERAYYYQSSREARKKWLRLIEKQACEKGLIYERTDKQLSLIWIIVCIAELLYTLAAEAIRIIYFFINSNVYINKFQNESFWKK